MVSRKVFKTLTSPRTAKYRTITSDEVQHDISVRKSGSRLHPCNN